MPIIVEDGSGVAGANSYASEDDLGTYADDRGLTLASGDAEAALIRATAILDAMYRGRFAGYKRDGRSQYLEWPRGVAYDVEGLLIDSTTIPVEVINAVCEIAIRELANPGSMMPDLERGGDIRSLKAGSVQIVYGNNASARTQFPLIDAILSGLLTTGSGGGLFGIAVRG